MVNGRCLTETCNNPPHSRGYCKTHYTRLRRWGDPDTVHKPGTLQPPDPTNNEHFPGNGGIKCNTCNQPANTHPLTRRCYNIKTILTARNNPPRGRIGYAAGGHRTSKASSEQSVRTGRRR